MLVNLTTVSDHKVGELMLDPAQSKCNLLNTLSTILMILGEQYCKHEKEWNANPRLVVISDPNAEEDTLATLLHQILDAQNLVLFAFSNLSAESNS